MANPVLVVGMHRSGTSLVSKILDDCGVMMGKDLQEDHEGILEEDPEDIREDNHINLCTRFNRDKHHFKICRRYEIRSINICR